MWRARKCATFFCLDLRRGQRLRDVRLLPEAVGLFWVPVKQAPSLVAAIARLAEQDAGPSLADTHQRPPMRVVCFELTEAPVLVETELLKQEAAVLNSFSG